MGADSMMDMDKQVLAAPMKSVVDKFQLLPEFLKGRCLVKQHLDSYNYFVKIGIKKIIRANEKIVSKVDPNVCLRYKEIWIGEPILNVDGVTTKLSPQNCRLSDMTSSTWSKKNAFGKEEVPRLVDDIYRKLPVNGATDLASKSQVASDSGTKLKEEVEDNYQMVNIRCPCGSSL